MIIPLDPASSRHFIRACLLALALALAGCSATSGSSGSHPRSAGTWAGREQVGAAIRLLNDGEPARARRVLARLLERNPNDAIAAKLVRQIDTSPDVLLGHDSFPYKTGPKDTMSSLAQRFLGDPMLFYALARYNGIDAPGALEAGRPLRIPGKAERPGGALGRGAKAPRPRPPPGDTSQPDSLPPGAGGNPAQASRLRAAGLEQMNRGAIARAVALLQEASRLDPRNPLIRRDLDRALRIQRTVEPGG